MSHRSKKTKLILAGCKILLAVVIMAFLLARIQSHSGFERLASGQKHWLSLLAAQALILIGFSLSFVRWYLLVRGLHLEFHLRDAFRLGSLGYMLNQVSPGSVGGDFLKAVFIAKEQPGRKTEAVATVIVDRIVGLCAMIVVAGVALAFAGQLTPSSETLKTMQMVVWCAAAIAAASLTIAMSPISTGQRVRNLADRIPGIGHTITRLLDALEVYRSRRGYLLGAFCIALATHSLVITAFWFITRGLPVYNPSFVENASIVPLGLVVSTIPVTPGGLGTLEAGFEFLYSTIGAAQGDGTIIALTYRAMTYCVAAIGACYYFSARKKVDRMWHDAESLAEEMA